MTENNKKQKRPPFWRVNARAKYDAMLASYREVQARILPPEEVAEHDVELPISWTQKPLGYLLNLFGKRSLPKGSGAGLVQSPYADIYTKVYGVTPIADLPKYRVMFRNQPDIQHAVQMQVNLALGRGFQIYHPDKKIIKFLEDICDKIEIIPNMLIMGVDALVYGNSFTEILWDKSEETQTLMYEYKGAYLTPKEIEKQGITSGYKEAYINGENGQSQKFVAQAIEKGSEARDILGLKCLDPCYMRVRRDSWGNVFGYIQWMAFPPSLIDNQSCMHIKNRPTSTGYESAYGLSLLMPIIKNDDLLNRFENDAAVWMYSRVVPPLIVKGGTPEKPYSLAGFEKIIAFNDNNLYFDSFENFAEYEGMTDSDIDGCQKLIPNKDIHVPSFDKNNKITLKRVTAIVRHKNNSKLYKIKTRLGREICVTPSHSLFKWQTTYKKYPFMNGNKGKIIECNVNDLKVGDYIVIAKILPVIEKETNLSNDLLWFLGMLIAEGYYNFDKSPRCLRFSSDQKNIEKINKIAISLGCKTRIVPYKINLNIQKGKFKSVPPNIDVRKPNMAKFITDLGFEKHPISHNKKIPFWIFQLPLHQLKYFLKGLYDGDGNHGSKNKITFVYTTASKELAEGLIYLLLRFGVLGGFRESLTKYGTKQYRITATVKTMNFNLWDKIIVQSKKYHTATYSLQNDLALVKIRNIEEIENPGKWVYDFEVEDNENFIAGLGVMVHNTTDQMNALMSILKSRTAATMIFAKGDVTFEEMKTVAADLNIAWWIDYLLMRRFQALGAPALLMGRAEKVGRATAEVLLQDFVSRLQVLQTFIGDAIEEFVFNPLIEANFGSETEHAKIIWPPIIEEDRNMRSQRLIQALQAGIVSVNEVRTELGFKKLSEAKYDEVQLVEPKMIPKGFPSKELPATQKIPEEVPESKTKLENVKDVQTKKFQLMKIENSFREKMLELINKTKFDLKDDTKLVKSVKREALDSAKDVINNFVVSSYLVGRVKANKALGKEDDLNLAQEDLEPISELKKNLILDFKKILKDMVTQKEEGNV